MQGSEPPDVSGFEDSRLACSVEGDTGLHPLRYARLTNTLLIKLIQINVGSRGFPEPSNTQKPQLG